MILRYHNPFAVGVDGIQPQAWPVPTGAKLRNAEKPCNRGIGVNRGHYRGPFARGRWSAPSVQESSIYGEIQGVEAVEAGGFGGVSAGVGWLPGSCRLRWPPAVWPGCPLRPGAHYARAYTRVRILTARAFCWLWGLAVCPCERLRPPTGWRLSAGSMAPGSGQLRRLRCCLRRLGPTLLRPVKPGARRWRWRAGRTGRIVSAVEVWAVRPGILHLRRDPGR